MKYSKIELVLFSAIHPTKLGPHGLGCFLWTFPMPSFWKDATAQGPRNFSMKWVIKRAQWFAWLAACRIVFGRHGNLIRFSDSWDWAAPNAIFRSISLEQWSQEQVGQSRGAEEWAINKTFRQAEASWWPADCFYSFLGSVTVISEKGLILEEWSATYPISEIE